jgi:2-oxoglutarate dehydrogenase E2 component (dihydrolipoamide succinyltransferase)
MSLVEMVMPRMGESIMEATILKWHKKVGDYIQSDETLLEIATDKVDTEVPSTSEGIIEKLFFNENDVVPIGAIIAIIKTKGETVSAIEPPKTIETITTIEEKENLEIEIPFQPAGAKTNGANTGFRFYSPLVLNIAANEGLTMLELDKIVGTGNENRVTKKDILNYISEKNVGSNLLKIENDISEEKTVSNPIQEPQAILSNKNENAAIPNQPTIVKGNTEIVVMDRMRKLIADHMIKSQETSAHVTSFAEADVTHLVQWREKIKLDFEKREGEKITFTPIFIEAIAKCLKQYKWLNSSVEENSIILKKDINIGMATALPNGNLIVPVIKSAELLNLLGLTKKVNQLANLARINKLKPEDTQNGTFTFTNVGTFGSLMGTPIINQPQVAILAVGAIKKRPVVIESPEGDSIAIRHMMYLSLSYDHRIIDGALGSKFLSAVVKELESFDINRTF